MKKEKEKQPNILKLLWFVYKKYYTEKKYKWILFFYLFFLVISSLFPLLSSYIFAKVIDQTIDVVNLGKPFSDLTKILIIYGIVMLTTSLTRLVYRYLETIHHVWMNFLEEHVYLEKMLYLEPQAFEDSDFIKDKNTVEWNLWDIKNSIYSGLKSISIFIVLIVSFISVLAINPFFALIALVASIPDGYITVKFGQMIWHIWGSNGEEKAKYAGYRRLLWTAKFEAFQEMKIFSYGRYLLEKAIDINRRFTEKLVGNHKKRYLSLALSSLWSNILYLAIIFFAVDSVLKGDITVGLLSFVISVYFRFSSDLSELISNISTIFANKKLLYLFYKVQTRDNKIKSGDMIIPEVKTGISLEFKNVWFKYPKTEKWIFKNVSFKIESDEDLAIVGKNGAGKTTMIKLLLRIYDVDKGDIFVNGVNIKDIDLDSYYRKVGILSQDFNKLAITAEDNIYVGDVEREKRLSNIREVAKLAEADETIENLPKKYKTYLTRDVNDGVNLSGGEWQKIAIARAFYRQSKLLILDEPTSAVDAIAEEKIFDNIRENAKHQTTLIVSHRFATVRKAKRILVIDSGKIVQDGNHNTLVERDGLYKEMYEKQVKKN